MSIGPCTNDAITPGVVNFDPAEFISLYPSFGAVPQAALEFNFALACDQLNNSCCSVVKDAPTRERLLGLLTAHITALLNGANGKPPSGIVGRVSNAAQGSVSVQAEYSSTVTDSEAYYVQTQWGAQFWQASLRYRTARYVAPCRGAWPTFGWYY